MKSYDNIRIYVARHCNGGFSKCKIDPLGNVTPCVSFDFPFGNIFEESLINIWNNDLFKKFVDPINLGGICRWCPIKWKCRGLCKAETFYTTGNMFMPHPHYCITKLVSKTEKNRFQNSKPEIKN